MIVNEALNDECIAEHNRLRAMHGCPALTQDYNLAMKAQRYAEQLTEQFEHEQSNEYGENVAVRSSLGVAKLSGKQATLMWYSEIANYNFDVENQLACEGLATTKGPALNCVFTRLSMSVNQSLPIHLLPGHFSQVVWKSTTHAGFGVASSADGHKVYLVGVYMPPANFRDEWVENVPRPLSGEIVIPTREEISEKLGSIPCSEANTDSQFTAAPQTFNNAMPTPYSYNGNVVTDFASVHPRPAKSECVLQESTVLELRPPWNTKSSRIVRIDEWFNCPSSEGGGMKSFERQTWYDIFTMEMIEVMFFEICRSLHDKEALLEAFRCEVLHTHNRYRTLHGVPVLKRNLRLDRMASEWAQKLKETGHLAYSGNKYNGQLMGENICDRLTVDGRITGQTLVGKWYEEGKQYVYEHEPESTKTLGHFTQLIWRKTKELGVGFTASNTLERAFIVCFYHPPGNVKSEYMENVCPPLMNL
ncbi:uncharacterized protein DEA37_0003127 [Paragonimus westermani]|uniref:SCP domain-containing protein n=1 Tax=Paragonimus westermani TaxID=34504 RepID=A0A5J4NM49_9TREM|nr:uncharacterized protein DEA37_0003127 [Paragonimus westermani]